MRSTHSTTRAQSVASGQRQRTVSTSTATLKHQINSIKFVSLHNECLTCRHC